MAAPLESDDLREVTARRELYRRLSRMGEGAVDVAERVVYAVVKKS
jgi:phosphate uptake regulator